MSMVVRENMGYRFWEAYFSKMGLMFSKTQTEPIEYTITNVNELMKYSIKTNDTLFKLYVTDEVNIPNIDMVASGLKDFDRVHLGSFTATPAGMIEPFVQRFPSEDPELELYV